LFVGSFAPHWDHDTAVAQRIRQLANAGKNLWAKNRIPARHEFSRAVACGFFSPHDVRIVPNTANIQNAT
jgi:hypothetical protein